MATQLVPASEAAGPSSVSQRQDFAGSFSVADEARMHVGNHYNTSNHHYTVRKRRSDETLQERQRDQAFLDSAAEGQLQRLKYLYRLGVDIDHRDEDGLTALHHAALSGFQDVVDFLWDIGCKVNAQDADVGTPLCVAALKGRANIVRYLIDDQRRARTDLKGAWNGPPLHCAAHSGHVPTIQALLHRGAGVNVCATFALRDWEDHGDEAQKLYASYSLNQVIVDLSPLLSAIIAGHKSAVEALLQAGA